MKGIVCKMFHSATKSLAEISICALLCHLFNQSHKSIERRLKCEFKSLDHDTINMLILCDLFDIFSLLTGDLIR